jgi:type II secretory pathway component PulJ
LTADKKGYFLLDAVLATLILSILLSAILISLETSLRALRKVNSNLVSLYKAEAVLIEKLILEDDFQNSGYTGRDGELSYLFNFEELEYDINRVSVAVSKDNNIQARISALILN